MKKCTRVGIDVTRRCNWRCKTCFYRWSPGFNTAYDKPLGAVLGEARAAKARGCDHVVLVGWGEPGMWPHLLDMIRRVTDMGMTSSIITNGSLSVSHYAAMREAGLNHLHVSAHGTGDVLDTVAGVPGAGDKQARLMEYLKAEDWPWRMNMTVQRVNYQHLAGIADVCLRHGCRHIISLGFLPHYEWNDPAKLKEVAVHPQELRPHIQAAVDAVEEWNAGATAGRDAMFTIRYHPMCHLDEKYRKYVVNARYVLYDPWEWDYGHAGDDAGASWNAAVSIGGTVSIDREPCVSCGLRMHCGGWNRVYAAGFEGAALRAIEMPADTQSPGWYHDQNAANSARGWF